MLYTLFRRLLMSRRVLVVDDEAAIVEGLMCLLEAEEIESSGAFDRLSACLLYTSPSPRDA